MKYNPKIHHRRSIRLKGYDYSQAGLYFITICCQDRECLFGHITNGEMILNDAGKMVETEWLKLPERFPNIALHEFVVMPNHFHAILEIVGATLAVAPNATAPKNNIVEINDKTKIEMENGQPRDTGQPQGIAPTERKTVGDMIGAFKSIVTVNYIRGVKTMGWKPFNGKLWQRNYFEHIIRNEQSYQTISAYIVNNPVNWTEDKFYEQM